MNRRRCTSARIGEKEKQEQGKKTITQFYSWLTVIQAQQLRECQRLPEEGEEEEEEEAYLHK